MAELQAVAAKVAIDQSNLEAIFSAFEMAKLLGRLGNLDRDEIDALPDAMKRLIVATLAIAIRFPMAEVKNGWVAKPHPPYAQLATLVNAMEETDGPRSIALITLNYDLCLDFALERSEISSFDYGLRGGNEGIRVLKLHGSINWGLCRECGLIVSSRVRGDIERVIPMRIDSTARPTFWHAPPKHSPCPARGGGESECDLVPYVVPPTWNKGDYYKNIQAVWRLAATELSDAQNVFVCGYSMPSSDQFFPYLLGLGTLGKTWLRRFRVFDPDPTGAVFQRFKEMLGASSLRRLELRDLPFEGKPDGPSVAEDIAEIMGEKLD